MEPASPSDENLAVWLKESGKRRRKIKPEQGDLVEVPQRPLSGRYVQRKWLIVSAVTAIAYLQYFYADVFLQIASLPSIIVFVLVYGQLPPL